MKPKYKLAHTGSSGVFRGRHLYLETKNWTTEINILQMVRKPQTIFM